MKLAEGLQFVIQITEDITGGSVQSFSEYLPGRVLAKLAAKREELNELRAKLAYEYVKGQILEFLSCLLNVSSHERLHLCLKYN